LFAKHREKQCQHKHGQDKTGENVKDRSPFELSDLEHCFFVNHDKTGATCSVYCSHERKLIAISFRGTCAPIDLLTDASIVQQAWVTGDDVKEQDFPKVHTGFRTSLESISRRLKELILATVAPGEEIKNYDMIVTGHSLGGALATLFTADIGQYGIDAGRGLPQLEASDPWWKSIANTFMGQVAQVDENVRLPPRPKTLRLYSFGSPRVGNNAFADLFDALIAEGQIDQAYRIVNGEDVVARMPRTVNALVFGEVRYEHCGPTVLISQPKEDEGAMARLWVEGESDNNRCPVRDGVALTSPTAEGSLLGDLVSATKDTFDDVQGASILNKFTSAFEQVSTRLMSLSASDVASILGIDRNFSEREMKLIQSLMEGKALAHHMEDEYYGGMGRASGFLTLVGEPIVDLEQKEVA
jgi:Lipase (class 3)